MNTLHAILLAGVVVLSATTATAATQPRNLPAGMTKADRDILGVVMAIGPEVVQASAPFYFVDADTFDVEVTPKKRWQFPLRVRVKNINAPESRNYKCEREKELARQAKAFVVKTLSTPGASIQLTDMDGFDDYGRYLAQIRVNGADLGEMLIKEGLARRWTDEYEGQGKDYWCSMEKAAKR